MIESGVVVDGVIENGFVVGVIGAEIDEGVVEV